MKPAVMFIYSLGSVEIGAINQKIVEHFRNNSAAVEIDDSRLDPNEATIIIIHGPRLLDLLDQGAEDDYFRTRMITTIYTAIEQDLAYSSTCTKRMFGIDRNTAPLPMIPILLHSGEDLERFREAKRTGGTFDALDMFETKGLQLDVTGLTQDEVVNVILHKENAVRDNPEKANKRDTY
ncbi:MAG: hypothetical protein M1822_000136 [Bathelium mastoideum]|nr:MAG: hypothetical protein M1822_000136 [Bathelium mastoideum]